MYDVPNRKKGPLKNIAEIVLKDVYNFEKSVGHFEVVPSNHGTNFVKMYFICKTFKHIHW